MAGGFDRNTRLRQMVQPAQTKSASGQLLTWQLTKTGLLARIYLIITGTVSGTITLPNALGMASIVRNVSLAVNGGQNLFSMSGAGYHYIYRNFQNIYFDPFPASNARAVVSATTFDVSFLIDVQVNQSDPVGLIMLQNEQTVLTLSVQFEVDNPTVGTGATVAATVTPIVEYFSVPPDPRDLPPLGVVHQVIEDQVAVPSTANVTYTWQRGNTYLQVLHGLGIAQAGADGWTQAILRANGTDYVETISPTLAGVVYAMNHPAARIAGVLPIDLMGSSGLGAFGKARDFIDSSRLTDLATVITPTGAGTLYTIRRMLAPLG